MKKSVFVKILTFVKYVVTFALGMVGGSNASDILELM